MGQSEHCLLPLGWGSDCALNFCWYHPWERLCIAACCWLAESRRAGFPLAASSTRRHMEPQAPAWFPWRCWRRAQFFSTGFGRIGVSIVSKVSVLHRDSFPGHLLEKAGSFGLFPSGLLVFLGCRILQYQVYGMCEVKRKLDWESRNKPLHVWSTDFQPSYREHSVGKE